MFDLELAIVEWRRQMAAKGVLSSETLDELQNHLREEVATLVAAGHDESEAFRLACARIGTPAVLAAEFKNAESGLWTRPATLRAMWACAAAVLAAVLTWNRMSGKSTPLLSAHVFCITAGYSAAFFAAALSAYAAMGRLLPILPPPRQRAWLHAACAFTQLAAGLVGIGWLLGMLWARQNWGVFPMNDPRVITALAACIGLAGSWQIQRSTGSNSRVRTMACIGGSALVTFAWFGAGLMAAGDKLGSFWPLNLLLGVHALFFLANLAPATRTAKA